MPIDRLLLVAGPSCAGKSTLIQRLYAGELPEIAARLRLGDVSAWYCALPKDLPAVVDGKVLLHYDFLRPWTGGQTPDYDAEELLRLARTASEVTLLTLWVPPAELHRRMAERRSTFLRALLRGRPWDSETLRASPRRSGPPPDRRRSLRKTWAIVRELWRLSEKVRSYRRSSEVQALYDDWLSFWSKSPAEHWILEGAIETRLVPAVEWQFRQS